MATCELRPYASGEEQCSSDLETPQANVHLRFRVDIVKVRISCQDIHHMANLAGIAGIFEACCAV